MVNNTSFVTNVPCTLPHDISSDQWNWYNDYAWWMEGFGSILVSSIGVLLNITSMVVLLSSTLSDSLFNWLLVCLALFDSLFLVTGILEAFRMHIGGKASIYHFYAFAHFLYPFRSVVMGCSIYMTITLALERYNALTNPASQFHANAKKSLNLGTRKNYFFTNFQRHRIGILKKVLPIIVFSTIYYIPKYMELRIFTNDNCNATATNCSLEYAIHLTDIRKSDQYVLWYLNVANLIFTTIIPLISLIYLNFNVYRKRNQYIQRQPSSNCQRHNTQPQETEVHAIRDRDKEMVNQTMILFTIVIIFGLSHALRILLNIEDLRSLEEKREALKKGCGWIRFWTIIVSPISYLLLQVNSSVNFFVYCFFNPSFRDTLIAKFKTTWVKKESDSEV